MPSARYILRLISAFVVRFKVILLAGAFLGILTFIFFVFIAPRIFPKSVGRIGTPGRYRVDSLPNSILEMVSIGLTKVEKDGSVSPALAKSWYTPDSGSTWIFELDETKTWQDGSKVTSTNVNYKFSDAMVEKPDEKTVVFKLESPFAPFPAVVAKPTFKEGLLGAGEWKVTNITVAGSYIQQITLENKNKEKKIYRFYPTEERTKLAYRLGQVDTLLAIFNPEPISNWKTSEVTPDTNTKRFVAIFLNIEDKVMGEKDVRQALAYGLDKEKLGDSRALGPISPDSWAYNPQVKPYNYDPERAKELIEDLPKEIKGELSIKLSTSAILLSTAEKIAKDWEAVGVKTTVSVSPGIPDEYQALLAIFDTPVDPDQYAIWHSTQKASNISKYKNPRIDKLLEDGRVELNLEERKKIYLDFQRFLVEDSPAVFLYHPVSYTIKRKS